MHWRFVVRKLATFALVTFLLFIAYSALFLLSYGVKPWDKIFGLLGSALLSILNMYFGYKIERMRHRREREVRIFEDFLYQVGQLIGDLGRVFIFISGEDV